MRNTTVLQTSEISNIITRFYYKDEQLCFLIVLELNNGGTIDYLEFVDYTVYRNCLSSLKKSTLRNQAITITQDTIGMERQSQC